MKNKIDWKKVWKAFDKWYYGAEEKSILHDWTTQKKKIKELIESQ